LLAEQPQATTSIAAAERILFILITMPATALPAVSASGALATPTNGVHP
jgi:hypothetical protein